MTSKRITYAFVFILVTVLLGMFIFLASLYYVKITSTYNSNLNKQTSSSPTSPREIKYPPPPPEAEDVREYAGSIVRLNASSTSFVLKTERGEKTVLVTDATSIVSRSTQSQTKTSNLSFNKLAEAYAKEKSYTLPLQPNDFVIAQSGTNIQGKKEFTANKIIVIN